NYITARRSKQLTVTAYRRNLRGYKINASSGAVTNFTCDFSSSPGSPDGNVSEVFGVTCIGSELFWLGRYGYRGYVWVTDLDGTFKRRFEYPDLGYSHGNPLGYKPGIGNDGSNVVIAHCTDAGSLRWHTYNKNTGALINMVDRNDSTKSDITGGYVGSADFGATRVVVAKKSTPTVQVFATNGNATSDSWYTAAPHEIGIVLVDGKFRTLDTAGVIHEYADRGTGDGEDDWWAAYRWTADTTPEDEYITNWSRISPPKRFTWPKRAGVKIIGQPLPSGPDSIGPSLAKKSTTPVRTDFHSPSWNVRE